MAIRSENNQVAKGRALGNRIVTLRSQSSIPSLVFKKVILPTTVAPDKSRSRIAWAGLGQTSIADDHSFDYEVKGHAMIKLLDGIGGNFHDSGTMVLPEGMTAMALAEPYEIELKGDERINSVPEWTLDENDLVCFMLAPDHKEYYECTGIMGQSMLASSGKRYILAQRFDMNYLNAFDESKIEDVDPPYK